MFIVIVTVISVISMIINGVRLRPAHTHMTRTIHKTNTHANNMYIYIYMHMYIHTYI